MVYAQFSLKNYQRIYLRGLMYTEMYTHVRILMVNAIH